MTSSVNNSTSFFLKHRLWITAITVLVYFMVMSGIASISILADSERNDVELATWEPYLWEFSSMLILYFLIVFVFYAHSKFPLLYGHLKKHLLFHFLNSVVFSLIHVFIMMLIRKLVYRLLSENYEFGNLLQVLVYEYRKDVLVYFSFLASIMVYQYIIKQLEGEAQVITTENHTSDKITQLLIKKKGKEYLIRLVDVSSIQAGGNYSYIHCHSVVYPMRSSMSKILNQLDEKVFVRVHRSFIVNINFIKEITTPQVQEYKIILTDGSIIPLARKNRPNLLEILKNSAIGA